MAVSREFNKTVFIVGAGASEEVHLPIGKELKQKIVSSLSWDSNNEVEDDLIRVALSTNFVKIPDSYIACKHICESMSQSISIDNFLDQHKDDKLIELCGKLAIVRTILRSESTSLLTISNPQASVNFASLEDTWFTGFWKLLTENCRREDLQKRFKLVVFVIFNYDRCIEHYLFHSLKNVYRMGSDEAAMLVNSIEIYHPYGTVGLLPWQTDEYNAIKYGESSPLANQLFDSAKKIKTFTESTDDNSCDVIAIRDHIRTSPRVVCLGFAFHELNMDLLCPNSPCPVDGEKTFGNKIIFSTAHGMSSHNTRAIKRRLSNEFLAKHENIYIDGMKCNELFDEYSHSLRFA